MTAADKIAEARALIAPLTGHTPGPWHHANRSEIHDRGASFDASGARTGDTPMLIAEAYDPRAEDNARLIAAAPAMRDTVAALADLAEAQAQRIAALEAALRQCADELEEVLRSEFEGAWAEVAFERALRPFRAALGDAS